MSKKRALLFFFRLVLRHYQTQYNCLLSYKTEIGSGLHLGHLVGIIINSDAVLGKNVNLSHLVTIGGAYRGKTKGFPTIGDYVFIGPSAKIFGSITISAHAAIGANSVVTKDVPENAVVVGIPGKVISYEGSADYILNTDYE